MPLSAIMAAASGGRPLTVGMPQPLPGDRFPPMAAVSSPAGNSAEERSAAVMAAFMAASFARSPVHAQALSNLSAAWAQPQQYSPSHAMSMGMGGMGMGMGGGMGGMGGHGGAYASAAPPPGTHGMGMGMGMGMGGPMPHGSSGPMPQRAVSTPVGAHAHSAHGHSGHGMPLSVMPVPQAGGPVGAPADPSPLAADPGTRRARARGSGSVVPPAVHTGVAWHGAAGRLGSGGSTGSGGNPAFPDHVGGEDDPLPRAGASP